MNYTLIAIAMIAGYLLGSIPFGLIVTRLAGQGDIRQIGSGNIGTTNVLRTGRKDLALVTLFLDAGKAAAAVIIIGHILGYHAGLIAGACALVGHCFPVWLKFQGGKGVATFLGCLLASAWPFGLAALVIWIGTALVTRLSSLSALCAAILIPIIAYLSGHRDIALMALFMTIIIIIRHKTNIQRLLKGTEPKIGKKS